MINHMKIELILNILDTASDSDIEVDVMNDMISDCTHTHHTLVLEIETISETLYNKQFFSWHMAPDYSQVNIRDCLQANTVHNLYKKRLRCILTCS